MLDAEHVLTLDRTCHDVEGSCNRSHQLSSRSGFWVLGSANDLESELGCGELLKLAAIGWGGCKDLHRRIHWATLHRGIVAPAR